MLPLIYGETESGYVIVASKGGFPQHPSWYLNLAAEPEVRLQVGAKKLAARARTAEADERAKREAEEAAKRERAAAEERGEADKILKVKQAEAEAASKALAEFS